LGIGLSNSMRAFSALILLVLSPALIALPHLGDAVAAEGIRADSARAEVTVITIYDNYEHDPELKTGWGFSCLVQAGDKNILFDTGAYSATLLANMKGLEIDPKDINAIVLSHIHGDHTGGLLGILKMNSDLAVYLPQSSPDDFRNDVESYKAKVVEVDDPVKIVEGVSSTGELGTFIKEQSLIVGTSKGLVVITGCAHPGIVDILKVAKRITGQDIYLVMGGFHLLNMSESELKGVIEGFRALKVKKVAASHCSGDKTRKLLKEEYKEDFISNGVGKKMEI
jgi:7,8-dihydropterin-6-yl-methyl-4-(beta-D-ribofuranosyl)aminobenzene 5'-phosphate synthase